MRFPRATMPYSICSFRKPPGIGSNRASARLSDDSSNTAAWRAHRISNRQPAVDSLLPIHLRCPAPTRIAWGTSKPSHSRSIRHISNGRQQITTQLSSGREPRHWRLLIRSMRHSRRGPRFEITNSRRIIYSPFSAIRGEDNAITRRTCVLWLHWALCVESSLHGAPSFVFAGVAPTLEHLHREWPVFIDDPE